MHCNRPVNQIRRSCDEKFEKAERKGKNLINKNAGDFKKKPQNKKFQSRNGKTGDNPLEQKSLNPKRVKENRI